MVKGYSKKEYCKNTVYELLEKEIQNISGSKSYKINETMKNNGVKYTALCKMASGVNPVYYIDSYVDDILDFKTDVTTAAKEILEKYEKAYDDAPKKADFMNKEYIKEHIVLRLINREMNDLSDIPYKEYLDLAVIMVVKVENVVNGEGTFKVTNSLIDTFGFTEEELFELAEQNTLKNEYVFEDITNVVNRILNPDEKEVMLSKESDMVVATTTNNINGAIVMTRPDKLADIAEVLDSDLYVLPSSVHEVLLVKQELIGSDEARNMVVDVNKTSVEKNEWLSNNVYRFSRNTKTITIA